MWVPIKLLILLSNNEGTRNRMCVHNFFFYRFETLGTLIKKRKANATHNTCRYCIVSVLDIDLKEQLVNGYIIFWIAIYAIVIVIVIAVAVAVAIAIVIVIVAVVVVVVVIVIVVWDDRFLLWR